MACDFCGKRTFVEDEYGRYTMSLMKLTPLPAINPTTGETKTRVKKPYYALFMYGAEEYEFVEIASFRVKFCPLCGKRLGDEE